MGNRHRRVQVIVQRFAAAGFELRRIHRGLLRRLDLVERLDSLHQAVESLFGGLQRLVRKVERRTVVGL